jgi:hypothetical protein
MREKGGIGMTMEWSARVARLGRLKYKVAVLSEQIALLEAAALPAVSRLSAIRGGKGGVSDPVGNAAAHLADEKAALVALRRCVMEEIGAVYDFIDAAPEARNVRTILRLRYIEDVGWAEIARRLGEKRRSTVCMRAKRYLAAADRGETAAK